MIFSLTFLNYFHFLSRSTELIMDFSPIFMLIYHDFLNKLTKMDSEKKKQNLSRKKIINSAIMLFANKGFESTSTREICRHAGVNLSLIPYYFGNKDGLYTSIIDSVINYGIIYLKEELDKADGVKNLDMDEKIELYKTLLDKYIDFLYSDKVPSNFVILMIKEQTISHSRFGEIYAKKISLLYSALRKILASILDKKENDKMIIFEVSSIIGQILGYKVMEKATLGALNQDFYTKEDNKKIKKIVLSYVDDCVNKLKNEALINA